MIIIWGFMGAGKSTIGKKFSETFGWGLLDTDEEIEQEAQMSIQEMFDRYGEPHFRALETAYLKKLLLKKQDGSIKNEVIITTGGGMPISLDNRKLFERIGKSIFIQVPFEEIVKRLQADDSRPLWDQEQLHLMKQRYESRLPIYQQANFIIDGKEKSIEAIVQELANFQGLI
jgi:shikimate kinase